MKKLWNRYVLDFFPGKHFYSGAALAAVLFVLSYFFNWLYIPASLYFSLFVALVIADYFFLFVMGKSPHAERIVGDRLSNGDNNPVKIRVLNRMPFSLNLEIIDELPFQFQERNFRLVKKLKKYERKTFNYVLRPVERGEYIFGNLNIYSFSSLALVKRRHIVAHENKVAVYPSFLSVRRYQLLAESSLHEYGNKRLRKLGHSLEFEQIKDYVSGDDVRYVNWKATARKGNLMVNNYVDQRSQQVYFIIDKGRLMKMPFHGLTLLDYSINSTLLLADVCLRKDDKAGLITFSDKLGNVLAADRRPSQMERILEVLYLQKSTFAESDFEMLYTQVRSKVKQRSLLVLYTNFESVGGLKRQLAYLKSIARFHLLLVIFFENTELGEVAHSDALSVEDVYTTTIAQKFAYEKKLIVKELQKAGILTLLTPPEKLNVNAVNKYLELKARQAS